MLWRVAVVLVCAGFVLYRIVLALEIRKAQQAGDATRVHQLRENGFGLYRWVVVCLLLFLALLTTLVWLNSR